MTDYIIIALLTLLVIENSRYGVRMMNTLENAYKSVKHFFGKVMLWLRKR